MTEASGLSSAGVSVEPDLLAEAVSQELAAMLQAGNYDAVKLLLEPVQPVDIAEAIGALPANLQAIAAEMGIAPRVAGLEKFPGGIGNRIEMADVRDNFETHGRHSREFPTGRDAIRVNQQLGQLALKGVRLEDRHNGNVLYNKATGRPMQIDFGIAGRVEGSEQVATLANATAEGFEAAGLGDVASIYRATVMDLLEGGDVADAMDVAKQGFSRLQKIK